MATKLEARKFVQESYDSNDAFGKAVVKAFLQDQTWVKEIIDVENYDVDLEVIDNFGESYFFEAEVKTKYPWTNKETFKFDTVSFLGRKEKWKDKNFIYALVCKETQALCFCNSSKIFKEEYKEVRRINSQHRKGLDVFYRVPKDLCTWIEPK